MCDICKSWKRKAVERNKKIKSLHKRIQELEISRDKWKDKNEKKIQKSNDNDKKKLL